MYKFLHQAFILLTRLFFFKFSTFLRVCVLFVFCLLTTLYSRLLMFIQSWYQERVNKTDLIRNFLTAACYISSW